MFKASSTSCVPSVVGHRPANDPPAIGIEHHGEIEKARSGRNVSDVGDPQPIRLVRHEVAINQIRRRPTAVPGRRHDELASARPDKTGLRPQPSDAFAPDTNALGSSA